MQMNAMILFGWPRIRLSVSIIIPTKKRKAQEQLDPIISARKKTEPRSQLPTCASSSTQSRAE